MSNPVLVEATRGAVVESRHRGAIAVVDTAGNVVVALGDVERPIFPRSAVKAPRSASPSATRNWPSPVRPMAASRAMWRP
jgi:L-asparaginase II